MRRTGLKDWKPRGKGQRRTEEAIPQHILTRPSCRREIPGRSSGANHPDTRVGRQGQSRTDQTQYASGEIGGAWIQRTAYEDVFTIGVAARRYQQKSRNMPGTAISNTGRICRSVRAGQRSRCIWSPLLTMRRASFCTRNSTPLWIASSWRIASAKPILKYGVPDSVYFDNGKQYRTKWMARTCSKLGIRPLYAKPYRLKRPKVEKFNQTVDSFLREAALNKPQTLEQFNQLFHVWLEECYQNKPHSALGDMLSPNAAYQRDRKALKFLDQETIASAFLHCEERKVDKTGCISFEGKKYEVGLNFIGCTVDVIYDPADTEELTIEYEGYAPWKVKQLVIGDRVGRRPKLPAYMQPLPAGSSRLLDAAIQKNLEREQRIAPAISYRAVYKEGRRDV